LASLTAWLCMSRLASCNARPAICGRCCASHLALNTPVGYCAACTAWAGCTACR
jgi:hypothetical protein